MYKKLKAEKNYKDTVFRMLYNDKANLLELYNAVNGTNYSNTDDLRINTLENAVYMNMKNDVSYVFRFEMNLYEHQSTLNPNMSLRNLFYVARLLEAEVENYLENKSIYGPKLIKIPTPRFIVFYNGLEDAEERFEYKLSDAYISKTDTPELELKVTVFNINVGKNKELLEHCKTLNEYSQYVDCIRKNLRLYPIDEAVENAVNYCIRNNILADFLKKNKAEVMEVAIYECDIEEEMKKISKDVYSDGFSDGLSDGKDKAFLLMNLLLQDNRLNDIQRATTDIEYRDALFKEYGI